MDGLLDFFSREAGQRRRAALDEFGRDVGYYVPPELRGLLGLAAEMTPSATIDRAAQAGGEMMAPDRTPTERAESAGRMLSETAGVAAPMMVAGRAAMPAAQAVQEGLLGFSVAADDVGRRVLERANQSGPVPTMYNNPVGRAADDTPQGIRAFQGSPHNFAAERLVRMPDRSTQYIVGAPDVLPDVPAGAEVLQDFPMGRMRLDKMGTGEGAQVYGDGIYLAENEGVARGYRDNVFGSVSSDQIPSDDARQIVNDQLQTFGATPNALEDAISDLRGSLSSAEATNKMFGDAQPRVDALNQAIDFLEQKADTRLMIGDQPVLELYDKISSTADRLPASQAELEYEKMAILEDLMNDGDVLSINEQAAEGAYSPEAFKWFQEEIDPNFKRQGSLYEVNVAASPEDFLDYDAPLSEQSAAVRQNLEGLLGKIREEDRVFIANQRQAERIAQDSAQEPISEEVAAFLDQIELPSISPKQQAADAAANAAREAEQIETLLDLKWGQNRSGSGLMAELSNYLNENKSSGLLNENVSNQTAEDVLRQSGVPGIKYFDAGSRNAAEGTRNYVVFDENLINIVRKYGIAGAAAMLGMTVAELQSQMGQAQARPQGLLE